MISIKSYGVTKGSTRSSSISLGGGSVTYNYGTTVVGSSEVDYADTAGYADEAGNAATADYATSAGAAATADYATSAANAVHANIADELSDDSAVYDRFLRKDVDDTAAGVITFAAGLLSEADVKTSNFDEDTQTGFGLIAQDSAATKFKLLLHSLEVWGKAIFHELEIRKLSYVGGDYAFSPAGSVIFAVEEVTEDDSVTGWKCWLQADDGTTATTNMWQVYDQARCETFNVEEGVYSDVENKYYWRLVTAVSSSSQCLYDDDGNELYDGQKFHYIILSASVCDDGSDEPSAGDSICCFGHRPYEEDADTSRQGVIIISTSGDEPAIKVYAGVSDFSLTDRLMASIAPSGVEIMSQYFYLVSGSVKYQSTIWCGEWTEGNTYPYNGMVTYNGFTYVCVNEDGTTEEPGTGDDWLCTTSATASISVTPSLSSVVHKSSTDTTVTISFSVMEGDTALSSAIRTSAYRDTAGYWYISGYTVPDDTITATYTSTGITFVIPSGLDLTGNSFTFVIAYNRADGTAGTREIEIPITTITDTAYASISVTPSRQVFIHHYGTEETLDVSFTVYEGNTLLSYDESGSAGTWRIGTCEIDEEGDGTLLEVIEADAVCTGTRSYVIIVTRSDGTTYTYYGSIETNTVYDSVNGEDGEDAWGVLADPTSFTLETDDDGAIPSSELGADNCYVLVRVVCGNDYYALSADTVTSFAQTLTNCSGGYAYTDDGALKLYLTDIDDGDSYAYTDASGYSQTYIAPMTNGSYKVVFTAGGMSFTVTVPFVVSVNKFVSSLYIGQKNISLTVDNITDGLLATGIDIEEYKVNITADNFAVQDNEGNERIATTSDGELSLTGYTYADDGSVDESGSTIKTVIDGKGFSIVHSGGASINMGFDADGNPYCIAYKSDGTVSWMLPAKAIDFDITLITGSSSYSESAVAKYSYSTMTFTLAISLYNSSDEAITFTTSNFTCVCNEGLTDYNTLTLKESKSVDAGNSIDQFTGYLYFTGSVRVRKTAGLSSSYLSTLTFNIYYDGDLCSTLGVTLASIA